MVKKRIEAWLDVNEDGVFDFEDVRYVIAPLLRHEWMFAAGLFIFVGSVGNVLEWWAIDSDAYWAAAGLAAMLEYIEDIRARQRAK